MLNTGFVKLAAMAIERIIFDSELLLLGPEGAVMSNELKEPASGPSSWRAGS